MAFYEMINKNINQLNPNELENLFSSLKNDYKKCSYCNSFLPITNFHSKKSRTNKCRNCIKIKNRKYYLLRKSKSKS